MPANVRVPSLDLLRFAAILAVVLVHSEPLTIDANGPVLAGISEFVKHGWVGVDLFFVLSGFLVSGLLFKEYQKYGSISVKRFLIRRGLKIYPAFYFMICVTLVIDVIQSMRPVNRIPTKVGQYLAEIFFVQNYFDGIWGPTWSLAVEEHFYLTFPLLLLILVKISPKKDNPFELLKTIFLALTGFMIIFDITFTFLPGSNYAPYVWHTYSLTHVRIDALLFGALISYFYHFERHRLEWFWKHSRVTLAFAFTLIILCLFTSTLQIARISSARYFSLGFGLILIVSVASPILERFGGTKLGRFFCFLGQHSYSIYLWHVPILYLLRYLFTDEQSAGGYALTIDLIYFVMSFAFGIAIAKLIEIPMLRMRDRVFPSRTRAV